MYHGPHSENSSFGYLSGIPGLSSGDSRSSARLLTGQSNIDPVADWTVTDLTWPLSSRTATRTRAMGHLFLKVLLSFNKTISPSVKFLFCRVNFALVVPYSTCSNVCISIELVVASIPLRVHDFSINSILRSNASDS